MISDNKYLNISNIIIHFVTYLPPYFFFKSVNIPLKTLGEKRTKTNKKIPHHNENLSITKRYIESQEAPLFTSSLQIDSGERLSVLYMLPLIKQRSPFAIHEDSHSLLQPLLQKPKILKTRTRQAFLRERYQGFQLGKTRFSISKAKQNKTKDCTIVRETFVENLSLSHQLPQHICQKSIHHVWVCFYMLYSLPLMYISVLSSTPHHFNNRSFIAGLKIKKCK